MSDILLYIKQKTFFLNSGFSPFLDALLLKSVTVIVQGFPYKANLPDNIYNNSFESYDRSNHPKVFLGKLF